MPTIDVRRLAPWVAMGVSLGCGSEGASASNREVLECAGPDETQAPVDEREPDETWDVAHDDRQPKHCRFEPDSVTRDTVGPDAPKPPDNLRVVVVMLENRSFDHYLSGVSGADVRTGDRNPNPKAPDGYSPQREAKNYCLPDTAHEWGAAHLEYDNGLLDGFAAMNNPGGERTLEYYPKDDLPFVNWLAETYAIGDRYFSSLLGPTWPNRMFLFDATSCGYTLGALDGNGGIKTNCSDVSPNLLKELDERGLHHKLYDEAETFSITQFLGFDFTRSFSEFEEDALKDDLPEFSMVGASNGQQKQYVGLGVDQDDDHPSADVRLGEVFMYRVVRALMANKETFAHTVLFIAYDENGGFYDHVPPPRACEPVNPDARYDYAFDRYGFRVPFIVVSPFVKSPGYVSHHITDHSSITRFVEHVWGLGALSKRDANAWPLLDYFDFSLHPAPIDLPAEPVVTGGCEKP